MDRARLKNVFFALAPPPPSPCDFSWCSLVFPFVLSFVNAFWGEGGPALAGNGLWSTKSGLLEKPIAIAQAAG